MKRICAVLTYVVAAFIGGTVLYCWHVIAWTLMPLHDWAINTFIDEQAVMQSLLDNAPVHGVYLLPQDMHNHAAGEPLALVNMLPNGFSTTVWDNLYSGVLVNAILVALVLLFLWRGQRQFWRFACDGAIFGVIVSIAVFVPMWQWFGWALDFLFGHVIELAIGWALAAALMYPLLALCRLRQSS